MPISDEDMIVATHDYFVTENVLNPKATPAEIDAFVKECKTTGVVTYGINQGGVRSVVVIERTAMDEDDANEVRRILGMDYEIEEEDPAL